MKNIGFDVAKPDRHINRAMGCFNLVHFANWCDHAGTKPPQATEGEMINVMQTMQQCANEVNILVTFLDNAIWLLCARSGLYFTNAALCRLTN
jgi:thermostable 8-oxoguanine DNA glycosylase